MIYDMRTYILKPGSMAAVQAIYEKSLPVRGKYSQVGAFFRSEIGTLNQIVHIWPYDDLDHMERARAEASADPSGLWPPPGLMDYIVSMESDLLRPLSFMKDWTGPQEMGSIYELRIYSLLPGHTPDVIKTWTEKIPARLEFSPIAGCWVPLSVGAKQNKLYHLWPYQDFADRVKVRAEASASGKWPPDKGQHYAHQKSKLLVPFSFSLLH